MVEVCVPGERWQVEFHEDGQMGVEVFNSSKGVQGPETLEDFFFAGLAARPLIPI